MKITELDFTKEGKWYRYGKIIFEIKDGDLINIESNAYLRDANISIAELLKMDFEEIKETKNPYTRVDNKKLYYVIEQNGWVNFIEESGHDYDNKMFNVANYFNNKEYAEYIAFKESLMRRLDRFAWDYNARVIDWDCDQPKHYIVFNNSSDNKLEVSSCFALQSNCVYFTSKEIAEQAIEEFKDDLIKLYTWKFDF